MTRLNHAARNSRDRVRRRGTQDADFTPPMFPAHRGDNPADEAGPAKPATRGKKLDEAVTVGRFWRNRSGEAVVVQLRPYEGRTLFDARVFFTNKDGALQATPKGLSIAVTRLPEFAAAVNKALLMARDLGLIEADEQ